MTLIVFPDIAAEAITWLGAIAPLTDIVGKKISTRLPDVDDWPAIRVDPTGGGTPLEFRIDQPRLQLQCFAVTDVDAMLIARTARAGLAGMAGLHVPGVLVVIDVTTSGPQFIETQSFSAARNRVPLLSHATFSATFSVRPDP